MTMYINCCVRKESRTNRLAKVVLQKLGKDYTELKLYEENLRPLDLEKLNRRTELIERGDFSDKMFDTGIVSAYIENGLPVGLCKANYLYYVTTAGGPYDPTYSYGYIESLAKIFFGIPKTHLVKAEMLDIAGNDAEKILNNAINSVLFD